MSLCLVIAHETATSPELRQALVEYELKAPSASFVLLVPATPGRRLLFPRSGRAKEIASRTADAARAQLEAAGLHIRKVIVGKAEPLQAIAEELEGNDEYTSILVCTHPAKVSRWLSFDLPGKAQAFGLPVMHLVVRSVTSAIPESQMSRSNPWLGL